MADAGVIIKADLKGEDLTNKIDKLVKDVDSKFSDMAQKIDDNVQLIKLSLGELGSTAQAKVSEIKQAFTQLGTTFDQFARAMERAAAAASSAGGRVGSGGNGGGGNAYAPNTIGALEQEIAAGKALRKEAELYSDDLKDINNSIERQTRLLNQETKGQQKLTEEAKKTAQAQEKTRVRAAISMPTNDIQETERKLLRLQGTLQRLQHTRLLDESHINRVKKAITATERELEKLKAKASIPTSMSGIMGMSERTLNDISAKMKAISTLRAQTPVGNPELSKLNAEYARLSRLQSEIIGKNATLIESNNSLARAFNYIRNRLAFTLTIGAFTGFVRQLYEVRGQYELLERSLGVLLDSFQQGRKVFQELSSMAIQSPFTLIELGTAAKQLTAYNFGANEVVNVTKRMADIAAAVGVPMERLVYNLGQIRAQTVLTARDARDFANAGLPIASALADMYSKLEGRVVSTGDVFDRMKKKAVSYNDVMSVLNQMTDEGGKFFDFQAKQADTLKVQLANLTLAWNNMLNSMGQANQGLLSAPIKGMKYMFENWRTLDHWISEVVVGLGAFKAAQIIVNTLVGQSARSMNRQVLANKQAIAVDLERKRLTQALTAEELNLLRTRKTVNAADYENMLVSRNLSKNQALLLASMNFKNKALLTALIRTKMLTAAEIRNITVGKTVNLVLNRIELSLRNFAKSIGNFLKSNWFFFLLGGLYEVYHAFDEGKERVREFNRDIVEGAKESQESITKFLKDYNSLYNSLYKWDETGNSQGLPQAEANKAWETMRDSIENSSTAASYFISDLEQIEDINERLKKGFGLLYDLQDAEGALKRLKENAIDLSTTTLGGLFGEGLKDDLRDYLSSLDEIERQYGDIEKAISAANAASEKGQIVDFSSALHDVQEFNAEIHKTTSSMVEEFIGNNNFGIEQQREAFERTITSISQKQELSTQEYEALRIRAEQSYYEDALAKYQELAKTQQGQQLALTNLRISQLQKEFNSGKAIQTTFFSWLADTQSSAVQDMLQNKTREEIKSGTWMKDQNIKWIEEQARKFSSEYGTSFDNLWSMVKNANNWSIWIPVYFNTIGIKSDIQKTLEAAGVPKQYTQNIESTNEALDTMKKRQKEVASELSTVANAQKKGVPYSKTYVENLKKENKSLTESIHNLNGLTEAEEKALKERQKNAKKNTPAKRQRQGEDAVAKALKDEISVIKEMQSAYDKLRKAGVNTTDALTLASSGYDRTLKSINATLSKYGIRPFKAEDFVGSADPHKLLTALQNQLDTLIKSGKVKTASLKDLEMEIQKITVDAKEYDMKRITDGLNNELGKIKEEYELAVELDANPELGDMFAQAFGIDTTGFPKTVQEAVDRMQDATDKAIAEAQFGEGIDIDPEDLMYPFDILRDDIDKWSKATGIALDSNVIESIKKMQKEARDLYAKDAKQTISDWQKLLEKYAEYETKRTEIQKQAEKERETARKHGASQEIFDAIDLKEQRNLAKLEFDEFQKSATWITATGDLSNLTNKALQMLIDRLWEYKRAAKNLDPKEIIRLNNALRKLRKEQKKDNPFAAWSIMLDEAKQRMEQYEPDIDELTRKINNLVKKQGEQHGILSDEDNQTLAEYLKNLEKLRKEQNEAGKLTLGDKLGAIQKYSNAIKEIADSIITIADGFGAEKISKAAEALKDALSVVDKAEAGYKLGGTYGAVAGAIFGIIEMLVKWFDTNEDINEQIEYSQRQVKKLENQYKDLQHAMENAYGAAKYGAQQAMIYYKKSQLAQLEEQLRLEKSRKSKHKDEDAIISLEGQIIDLKNEIHDAVNDIVEDMLGISSVGDAAENMVKSMIEAFKNGEDYMKVFEESFDDMVDNMIAKTIVSRLIGDFIQGIFDQIKARKVENASGIASSLSYAQSVLQGLYDFANEFGMTDSLQQNINEWEANVKRLQDAYKSAITPTPEDVAELQDTIAAGKASIKEGFDAWMAAFGIQFGQNSEENAQLSALQQGIMGITEDTAGALEAYMNGVSQQVYLHSDLLTQIRDILINFGGDVTIATNAQILLQLQQSFQVQMTIQNVLTGVLNASGLAFRVEMV